jgi:predicted Zn-dependent protease
MQMRGARNSVLALTLLTGGCASGPQTGADVELRLAAQSIEAGRPDHAEFWLERARLKYRGEAPEYVTLLSAEAKLRRGQTAEALAAADEVLAEDPMHAVANEVAGKVLLRMERFADAEQRFLAAQTAFAPGSAESQRLEDYIRLARGLDAYAKADPAVARQHWESIADAQLRYSVDESLREEASK